MEIIEGKLLLIRNYEKSDFDMLAYYLKEENSSKAFEDRFFEIVKESFSHDFSEEGEKHFAIASKDEISGRLTVTLEKPSIFISYSLYGKFNSRVYIQDLIVMVVKHLHLLYPHRDISIFVPKFDLKVRSIVENLGFKISSIDHLANIYKYSIFLPNPNKDK